MRYGVLALLLLPPAPAPADLPRGIEKRIYESRQPGSPAASQRSPGPAATTTPTSPCDPTNLTAPPAGERRPLRVE